MSTKLLAVGDAGVRTGFERVVRGILTPLQRSGDFEIVLHGIGYRGMPDIQYDFQVYPAGSGDDILGLREFAGTVKAYQPDVIWFLQDLWNITTYMALKPFDVPAVAYFPVDAPNLKPMYTAGLGGASAAVTYATFGAQEAAAGMRGVIDLLVQNANEQDVGLTQPFSWLSLKHPAGGKLQCRSDRLVRFQNPAAYHVVPHALDLGLFGVRDRKQARDLFGLPHDAFVVLNVNTDQERKRLDLTMRAFALMRRQVPNAKLVLQATGHRLEGWDLNQLAHYFGIEDDTFLIHEIKETLTEEELVELYNTADVQINTGGGEGWGLTASEGAACGIPQLVPDWSVTRELWRDYGVLLPVHDYMMWPKYINTAHAIIDVAATAQILVDLAGDEGRRIQLSHAALEFVSEQPTWEEVSRRMRAAIEMALVEPAPTPMSLQQALDAREGVVESELSGRPII